ncbi:MAG: PIN domain-containing protein [Mucilaginibacter polytrichastri]|nr:PIN domain-containing protein [Mucilaginibacter polytrichastri]
MIFIDSDIILDTALRRVPFAHFADELFNQAKEINLGTSAHCLLNVYYLGRRSFGSTATRGMIGNLIQQVRVFPVDESHLSTALVSRISDFEDAVQHAVAVANNCRYLITRNLSDYKHAELPVLTAEQFLNTL